VCVIGVRLNACKKCHRYCIGLQRSKMPPTQRKCVGGLSYNCFFLIVSWELQIPLNEWPSNMPQLWGLKHIQWTSWQMSYGVKIGMQNILWTIQPRYHLGKWSMICMTKTQRHEELFSMSCTHWWGLHIIGLHLTSDIKGSHRQFVVATYGVWCNLHDLSKTTCSGLVNCIKPDFASESCYHV